MCTGSRQIRKVGLMTLVLVLAAAPAVADSINPGDTVSSALDPFDTGDQFQFDGDKDDYVTILLLDEENEPLFYPVVELTGPFGIYVTDSDPRAAMIFNYRLPIDGEYTINVTRAGFSDEDDQYVLTLISTGSINDGGDIAYGSTIAAALDPAGDMDGYWFHAIAGDRVTIYVEDSGNVEEFRPQVDLIGPNGWLAGDGGDSVAAITDQELEGVGDYTIIVWGGGPDWGGGSYELTLHTPSTIPTPTPTPVPLPYPDLHIAQADAAPAAPTRLAPGQSVVLGAFVENLGQPTGPFWLEFWGSRTGGLTLDAFIADSEWVPGLGLLGNYSFAASRPIYNLPDGPYSVVVVVDRPGEVSEWDEGNNRMVIGGKRLLVLRPQVNVDLAVEGFGISAPPLHAGQEARFNGTVRNAGTENSGFFWIEFWYSPPTVFPATGWLICDSIPMDNLAPGRSIDLSFYPRTLYLGTSGDGHVGVVVDRPDWVNETDETNNYQFQRNVSISPAGGASIAESLLWLGSNPAEQADGEHDVEVASAAFSPAAPSELQPGSLMTYTFDVINHSAQMTDPFYVEFWGSRTGGLTLDLLLVDSVYISGLNAGQVYHGQVVRSLYPVPDGPYTLVVVADRPGNLADPNLLNNRLAVAGQKLLTIRPATQSNLRIEGFTFGPSTTLTRGAPVTLGGAVRNVGTQACASFWIEFWASVDQMYPAPAWYVCDSIHVRGLMPGETVSLYSQARYLYGWVPVGACAIGCVVDATDMVNETDESDNYVFLSGYLVY